MLEGPSAATDSVRGRPGPAIADPGGAFARRHGGGWRTLHAVTGVVPLGLFLVGHLWSQLAALGGHQAYDAARGGLFAAKWLELVFVLAPLAFHAGFGVVIARRARANVDAYPLSRNWMYAAQRVTGLVTFAFVVWHVVHLWAPQLVGTLGPHQMYPKLEQDLSSTSEGFPVAAFAMIVGTGASTFHFANGIWGFVLRIGLVRQRSRQAAVAAVSVVLGVLLFVAGVDAIVYFATGVRMMPVRSGR